MANTATDEAKQQLVTVIEEVVQTIWDTLAPIVGKTTTQVLLNRGVDKCEAEYPWVSHLRTNEERPDLAGLWEASHSLDMADLGKGIAAYIGKVIEIMTLLTGDVLTRNLQRRVGPMIEQIREGGGR